jgi:hypothetical protein
LAPDELPEPFAEPWDPFELVEELPESDELDDPESELDFEPVEPLRESLRASVRLSVR